MATTETSITPQIVATLATIEAIHDLRLLLFSLAHWNKQPPTVYLYADTHIAAIAPTFKYPGKLVLKPVLERYGGKTRRAMEQTAGETFPTLWFDFMTEKINLLEWVFEADEALATTSGVLFCDADICFLGPLPQIPGAAQLAVSPHGIRLEDEAKYGAFNGGFLWTRCAHMPGLWREKCYGARYFEQSALEDVEYLVKKLFKRADSVYLFPVTQNYGWWRMWQGRAPPAELQREWTMNRNKAAGGAGILIHGEPLGSVHTHFYETRDAPTIAYNRWVVGWLRRIERGWPPARAFLRWLESNGPMGFRFEAEPQRVPH